MPTKLELEREFAKKGVNMKMKQADPKAPVHVQVGGRPTAPNPKRDDD